MPTILPAATSPGQPTIDLHLTPVITLQQGLLIAAAVAAVATALCALAGARRWSRDLAGAAALVASLALIAGAL